MRYIERYLVYPNGAIVEVSDEYSINDIVLPNGRKLDFEPFNLYRRFFYVVSLRREYDGIVERIYYYLREGNPHSLSEDIFIGYTDKYIKNRRKK